MNLPINREELYIDSHDFFQMLFRQRLHVILELERSYDSDGKPFGYKPHFQEAHRHRADALNRLKALNSKATGDRHYALFPEEACPRF